MNTGNEKVEVDLLNSIKNFMVDLSSVTESEDFKDYCAVVDRIDETKVKSYTKLITGFKNFFETNLTNLTEDNFNDLVEPNISFVTGNDSISFDFQKMFQKVEEAEQEIIKDHLNHIWALLNTPKSPEEIYINNIFRDLKSKFSPDLTREEQMMIAKDLFSDFQKQDLDISIVVKVACKKAREMLKVNGPEDHSKMFSILDAIEEIDVNNFNLIQFMGLVSKVGILFGDGDLSGILSGIFTDSNLEEESDHQTIKKFFN